MRLRTLLPVLAVLIATLGSGYAARSRCADGNASGLAYSLCYTDMVPLYRGEGIDRGRLPYLEPCPPEQTLCDEYPVVQMWLMRGAGAVSTDLRSFFDVNAMMLTGATIVAAIALAALVGRRALYLTAAPTLATYAFLNWDLYSVAMAALALLAFARRRDAASGVLIGLGASTKLFPALLLIPFVADRLHAGDRRGAGRLMLAAAIAWLALNAPFAVLAWDRWWTFFGYSGIRPPEWSTLWYIACRTATGENCTAITAINLLSTVLLGASVALVWWWRRRDEPDFARWTLAFPIMALFLLTTKVYSPQYSLWLLPLFATAFPRPAYFGAFSLADVAVNWFLFSWFGAGNGETGVLLYAYQVAVIARALVLAACVIAWARGRVGEPLERGTHLAGAEAPAPA